MAIKDHESDYKPQAWDAYTIAELGNWVHLLAMRAGHRASADKRATAFLSFVSLHPKPTCFQH